MKQLLAVVVLAASIGAIVTLADRPLSAQTCEFWVAPDGNDLNSGSSSSPWATLTHAASAVPDMACLVLFEPGVYPGGQELERRFTTQTTFRSLVPYGAVFEAESTVIDLDGARNVVLEGFEVRHASPAATGFVINVDREGDTDLWAEQVVIRNNIIHDSFDDDLLKIHNGVRFATVEGNVFYNQGPGEQHMDVNSVTDVTIQDNIFFNDFAASARTNARDTQHYIVVKDSNGPEDGLSGSERVTIRRNVFAGWEGGRASLIQLGNGGKPYHEAEEVRISDNLFLGTGPDEATTVLGIAGARGVSFVHNTVSGDLPALSYGLRVVVKGDNPMNEAIELHNNIWADPSGTMGAGLGEVDGDFSSGDPTSVSGVVLRTNIYWNGGAALPSGDIVGPEDDPSAVVADPGLSSLDPRSTLPVWSGSGFRGGDGSIREAFVRLASSFGSPMSSAARAADSMWSTGTDILGSERGAAPTLGAVEVDFTGLDSAACPAAQIISAGFGDLGGFSLETVDSIDCLAHYGITQGTAPGVFDPTDQVFRWQMALFLVRSLEAAGVTLPVGADQGFVDLAGLSPEAVVAVNRLAELGVTRGTSPGVFDPGGVVPRWQMALFLVRSLEAAGVTLPVGADQGFVDLAGLSPEAVVAVNRLAELGVTRGTSPGVFDPGGVVPRWQMALFLARWLDRAGATP